MTVVRNLASSYVSTPCESDNLRPSGSYPKGRTAMSDDHKLYDIEQQDIAGSPWIGYCMCGTIFKAPTESEVRDAHRVHVDKNDD